MAGKKVSREITAIIGAGITGLTAAHLLSNGGEKCVIFEQEEKVGGLCRSYLLDDIIFDLGPHLFFNNPEHEAERLMMELLKDEKVIERRFRFAIESEGRCWKFPLSLFDLLSYPKEYQKHFLMSFLRKKNPRESKDRISMEQDLIEKGGQSYYERIFAPMLMKKTLLSGNQIHRDWGVRVDRNVKNEKEPFREESRGWLFKKVLQSLYQTYYYPVDGFQKFTEILRDKYTETGGEIIVNCGPLRFEKMDNKLTRVKVNDKAYPVKNVIWTGSLNGLNGILGNSTGKIRYVKTLIAFLTYNQKNPVHRPFVYAYYTEKNLIFNRVYWPASIYRNQAPRDKEGICLELNYIDDLDHRTDEEILRRAVEDIDKKGLFKKDNLRNQQLVRLGECLPVYELDYERKMSETFKRVHGYCNLYSIGRLGGFYFCMTPMAVSQGIKMSKYLLQTEKGNL